MRALTLVTAAWLLLAALYRMALQPKGPVRVAVVGGDHGFAGAGPDAEGLSRRNHDLAARNAADAARAYLSLPPGD